MSAPATLAFARAATYRFLAESLSYPTAEGLARLRTTTLSGALAAARHLHPATASSLRAAARAIAPLDRETAERAHVRVFGHARASAAPYEGPYLTTNLFQETDALADVAGFYRAFGVDAAQERADHIALELEFVHLLSFKEGHARRHRGAAEVAVCADAQAAFLRAHLGRWGATFFRRLAAEGAGTHYAAVGGLGEAFLAGEAARVGAEPRAGVPRVPDLADLTCPLAPEVPA